CCRGTVLATLGGLVVCCAAQRGFAQDAARTDRHGDPLPAGALARIGTPRFRGPGSAYSVAYSPTGRHIAVGSSGAGGDSSLVVFEAATGKVVHRLAGHAHVVRTVAFSADGALLASGGGDEKVAVWDVVKGKRLWLSSEDAGGD